MSAKNRLLARTLQIDSGREILNGIVFYCMIIIISSCMPLLYLFFLLPYAAKAAGDYGTYLNLLASVLMILISFYLFSSVRLGFKRFFLKKAEYLDADFTDIVYYFKITEMIRTFVYCFKLFVYKSFFALICIAPFILMSVLYVRMADKNLSLIISAIMLVSSFLFILNGLFFFIKINNSLFLTDFYFISGEYVSFSHILASSQCVMKNKASELSKLKISFIGWFTLCVFIIPIGYVFGYYGQAMAVLASKYIKE